MDQSKRVYYPVLDGMRGLVALAVVVYHYLGAVGWLNGVPRGYLGVDFFFVLSGFVIEQAYADRLLRGGYLASFAVQRVIRLWPMILAGAALGWVASFYDASSTLTDAVLGALVLPHLGVPGIAYPTNSPTWSLFFEIVANSLYAVILVKAKNVTLSAFVLASGLVLAGITLYLHRLNLGFSTTNFVGGLPRVMFSLFLGVLLRRWLRSGSLPFAGAASCAALVACLAFPILPSHNELVDLGEVAIAFPLIVVLGARADVSRRWNAICKWSGEVSYPLYLLHFPLLVLLKPLASAPTSMRLASTAGMTLAAVILSSFVLQAYDRPVRSWLARRMRSGAHAPVYAR